MTLWLALWACGGGESGEIEAAYAGPTYWRDAGPVLDARCVSCHQAGNIAPFPLTTYEEAAPWATALAAAVESGTMPPWPPADGCNEYHDDPSLSDAERDVLVAWADAGAPEGDPADAPLPPAAPAAFEPDVVLTLAEPYTPPEGVDDYRCFLLEWPEADSVYVTGMTVLPDRGEIVHHVVATVTSGAAAESLRAADEADPAPGYACGFGGSVAGPGEGGEGDGGPDGGPDGGLGGGFEMPRALGGWVPGSSGGAYPAGTGIEMYAGDVLMLQFHYNTIAAPPAPDRSSVAFTVASTVEKPAAVIPLIDLAWLSEALGGPMTIPADDPEVVISTTISNAELSMYAAMGGLPVGGSYTVHGVGTHMHLLGVESRVDVLAGTGEETCLLQIDDWDFHWQGAYTLVAPVVVGPEDTVRYSCTYDNSAANQSGTPVDVTWGEGTADEMCLGSLYVTAE